MPVNEISFTKRIPPSAASRGTLAELIAKQKALSDAAANFQTPQPIQSWTQGAAQLTGALGNALQSRRAESDLATGREELARIQAGVNQDTGATQEQIAEMGRYDPSVAENYRQEAAAARAAERARQDAIANREDTQAFTSGENKASREATAGLQEDQQAAQADAANKLAIAKAAEDKAARTGAIEDRDFADRSKRDAEAAKTAADEKAARLVAEAKVAEPQSTLGKLVDDYNSGRLGEKGSEEAKAILNAGLAKETAATKGITLSVDKDGNISFEQGGTTGSGGVSGSTQDIKQRAMSLDEYRAAAKAANEALPGVQSAKKVIGSAGYTGPGQGIYGTIDDTLEAMGSMVGIEPGTPYTSLPGTGAARDVLASGSLEQVLSRVQQTKGSISNAEMGIFERASLSLGKTPGGNKILADMAEAIIQRANERADRAQKWYDSHGQNMAGFEEQEWNPYINANPVIGEDPDTGVPMVIKPGQQQKQPATDTGAPAAAGAPPSEDDIQETMRQNGMTRQQVLDALAKQNQGGQGGGS